MKWDRVTKWVLCYLKGDCVTRKGGPVTWRETVLSPVVEEDLLSIVTLPTVCTCSCMLHAREHARQPGWLEPRSYTVLIIHLAMFSGRSTPMPLAGSARGNLQLD